MRSITLFTLCCALTLAACSDDGGNPDTTASATTATTPPPMACTIDGNSIAGIPLGTTIAQVRQQFPKAIITPLQDAEGVAFTSIKLTPDIELFAYTENTGSQANDSSETSPITYLSTASRVCKTNEGVAPNMLVADAEQIYGAVQQIVMSETDGQQTAEFDHQPPELSIQIDDSGAFDLTNKHLPKITTDYRDDAKIQSIAVIALPDEEAK